MNSIYRVLSTLSRKAGSWDLCVYGKLQKALHTDTPWDTNFCKIFFLYKLKKNLVLDWKPPVLTFSMWRKREEESNCILSLVLFPIWLYGLDGMKHKNETSICIVFPYTRNPLYNFTSIHKERTTLNCSMSSIFLTFHSTLSLCTDIFFLFQLLVPLNLCVFQLQRGSFLLGKPKRNKISPTFKFL